MSEGDDDTGVTPPKQYKPNETEPIFVVGEEVVETSDEMVQEIPGPVVPSVVIEPEVVIEIPTVSAITGQKYNKIYDANSDEQYNTDDSQSIVSDDGQRDVQKMKEILIVSEHESDENYEEEEESAHTDASERDSPSHHGPNPTQLDVNMLRRMLLLNAIDSDEDSFYDGDSDDSDDPNGLPPDWELHEHPNGQQYYYHVPSGRVTSHRPRMPQGPRFTRTMGYENNQEP